MTFISRRTLLTVAGLSTAAWLNPVRAQLAGKPITLIVPTAAGGTTDIAARMLAEPLGRILQTSVVVDNRGGGNGNIAGQMVARGPADGTSLLVQYSGYQCITPLIQPVPGFDPATNLKPLGHLIDAPQLLVVRGNFPADNFADFIKYVKANPGKVNYASSGNGSLQHVTTELLKDLTKTFMVHIPYRGTGPALNDLLAGTVDFTITTPPPLLPHIRAGKLKALMVTGRTRLAAQPNVPTATEAGVPLVASSWFAVYGPTGLSADLQSRLSLAIKQVVESEGFKKRAEEQGAKAVVMSGAELATLGDNERKMWGRIVKLANIKAD
ncbi:MULTISPECIES: tripartite tricarboxylate transporter substrate binding protein [unclassified Polaromonas]|uniref:Bug family tripartite tricarboxylate transporter substrate binding protein n=1 Tax=unclassified Polaromonas TaxID=2638319 RepID=UPI000F077949|nr:MULTISPECIES: tripartite tricarboxylate transporter substrate binding protein [unclassified Polaromonas]AYQ27255.1 tripartite tricarboxylate transporter substrate binding protein [Polaromonas sp. SP1]QGJ17903.1 tripartite tricarboxylate transporter substrate binding protein [Polaromonas sp. Pch-P]